MLCEKNFKSHWRASIDNLEGQIKKKKKKENKIKKKKKKMGVKFLICFFEILFYFILFYFL